MCPLITPYDGRSCPIPTEVHAMDPFFLELTITGGSHDGQVGRCYKSEHDIPGLVLLLSSY